MPRLAAAALLILVAAAQALAGGPAEAFARVDLPDAWEATFWADPNVRAVRSLAPWDLADLVPKQAGIRHCGCPACGATDAEAPLSWSPLTPKVVTCRRCQAEVPNDDFPAKVDKKVPVETVEVRPGVEHSYPYHAVEPLKARYPEERLYLEARRDYLAREFLAKFALYASVRHRDQPPGGRDAALALSACVILVRFAQVYPDYAAHFDQPGEPPFFQPADLKPPYRRGYKTAKWDWLGSLDVPLNLVIAHALLRDDPAMAEAGRLLGVADPAGLIERDLFRASARFVRDQPEEFDESSLPAYRGMLAAGRLLDDPAMVAEALARLDGFATRGFHHDGLWRRGDPASHRRVLGLLDSWVAPLLVGEVGAAAGGGRAAIPGLSRIPMLALAREASAAPLGDPKGDAIVQAAWPAAEPPSPSRRPMLLGGAGLARLAVGDGADALDLELCAAGSLGGPQSRRLGLRLAVAGRAVLGDLDDLPPGRDGFDLSTVAHNAVVVDGLNQRESPSLAKQPAAGGEVAYYAADPDFQVASVHDPRAYPKSTTRYRHTLLASAGPRSRYAVGIFEVHGGSQHDQWFHAPPGSPARWTATTPRQVGPESLLPASIEFLPEARAEDGRWFVQSYGAFRDLAAGRADTPQRARLAGGPSPPLTLHLMPDPPTTVVTATGPGPSADRPGAGRSALMVRRASGDGTTLKSTFVTLYEPETPAGRLLKVGRVSSPLGTVVLYVETADGPEHLAFNLEPGTTFRVTLADGRLLKSDGLVVRSSGSGLVLAGGTFAALEGRRVEIPAAGGKVVAAARTPGGAGRGWFELAGRWPDDPKVLAGRVLSVRHGDGVTRAWTVADAEPTKAGRLRLHVREEVGFAIDPSDGSARYVQFPGDSHPGPHVCGVAQIGRDDVSRPAAAGR